MKQLRWVLPLLLAGIVVVVFLVRLRGGLDVIIRNTGTTVLHDAQIEVTGRSYGIGDLQPQDSRTVRIEPAGESSVVLSYADAAGARQKLDVATYIEPGFVGSISVDITDGKIVRKDQRIRVR